jgi:hypothetical protein
MNLHPIIVHIPIACLALYSILERILFFKKTLQDKLIHTKYFLLFVGVIGSFIALQTGERAEHLLWGHSNLIEMHSTFANLSHFSYIIIAIIYGLNLVITHKIWSKYRTVITKQHLPKIKYILNHMYTHYSIILLSGLGFILLSITGALGWAISHGTTDDPLSAWAVNTFVSK